MASFGFKNMAFVEVTGRQDWFSTVSKPVFYPSVTGSFVFTSAWKNKPSWLSYGKARVAWAQAGNDTGPYRLMNYPTVNTPFRGSPDYIRSNTSNNPDLVPEVKETKEAGLELRFFKDRVSINASIYDILSKDLIIPLPIDAANGYNWKYVNSGEMSNKGLEVTLSVTPIQTQKFNWNLSWNFSKNNNKLEKLAPGIRTYRVNWDKYGQVSLYAIEGRPFGELYGRDFVYDDKGNRIVQSNGKYATSELKALGNIIPDYTMGLTNSFGLGRLNFSFVFDFQKGGNYFSAAHMTGMSTGMLRETVAGGIREYDPTGPKNQKGIVLPGVTRSGAVNTKRIDPQTYGEGFFQGAVDKQNIFDATYLKLRSVSLSYDVPLPSTKYIKNLNVSLFGNNLWTTGLDWDGMDPETAASNQGIGEISLPTTRSFGMSVGLKL
jgi:tonB-dependent receptor, plug